MTSRPWSGVALSAFVLAGCVGRSEKVLIFFCGCEPCHYLAAELGSDSLDRAEIHFSGSPGDADAFGRERGLRLSPIADVKGDFARQHGIERCPAVRFADGTVLGNGRLLSADEIELLRRTLLP